MNDRPIIKHLTGWAQGLKKYRYAALILLLGVGLMLIPQEKKEQEPLSQSEPVYDELESQLEMLLGTIDGAGEVEVLLTLKEGTRYTYQTDEQYYTDSSEEEREKTTVLVSNGNGTETAVVSGTMYPVYMGAVVVCEGADNSFVKLSIVNAVSDLTGLGSDKISVIKMKDS